MRALVKSTTALGTVQSHSSLRPSAIQVKLPTTQVPKNGSNAWVKINMIAHQAPLPVLLQTTVHADGPMVPNSSRMELASALSKK